MLAIEVVEAACGLPAQHPGLDHSPLIAIRSSTGPLPASLQVRGSRALQGRGNPFSRERMLDGNSRLVTPVMVRQGGGAIVNVSTFSAFEPSPAFPLSSSLRAALAGFTKLYADRYAADGVRMNSVLPGYVESFE